MPAGTKGVALFTEPTSPDRIPETLPQAVQLKLPVAMNIHPVFHMSLLKPVAASIQI